MQPNSVVDAAGPGAVPRARWLALLGLFLVCGCSPQPGRRVAVAGTVLVDGQPLPEGSISFFPVAGIAGPTGGGVILNGKYEIPAEQGPVIGRQRVEIRGFRNSGRKIPDIWHPGELVDQKVGALGPEFNSQSILVRDINDTQNRIDFNLPGIENR
jgi:hypothetical protein